MQVGQFPASAATSLIDGYCDDFVSLATVLAQTLEQVSIRGIKIDQSRKSLERIERGMREMAEAIVELLQSGKVTQEFEVSLGRTKKEPAPPEPAPVAPPPAPAAPRAPAPMAAPAPWPMAPRPAPPAPAGPPRAAANQRPAQPPAAPERPPAPPPVNRPATPPATRGSLVRTRLEALERDRSSGTLYVQTPHELLAFEFLDGLLTQTASDSTTAAERIGDLLVELRSCTREQITPVVARLRAEEAHLLGEVLVREGVVTNRQVIAALEVQALRRMQRAAAAADVRIEFAPDEMMADDGRLRLSPSAALRQPPKPGS